MEQEASPLFLAQLSDETLAPTTDSLESLASMTLDSCALFAYQVARIWSQYACIALRRGRVVTNRECDEKYYAWIDRHRAVLGLNGERMPARVAALGEALKAYSADMPLMQLLDEELDLRRSR